VRTLNTFQIRNVTVTFLERSPRVVLGSGSVPHYDIVWVRGAAVSCVVCGGFAREFFFGLSVRVRDGRP
jgi:hypothetical protein